MYKLVDAATATRNYLQLKATTIYAFSPVIVTAKQKLLIELSKIKTDRKLN